LTIQTFVWLMIQPFIMFKLNLRLAQGPCSIPQVTTALPIVSDFLLLAGLELRTSDSTEFSSYKINR